MLLTINISVEYSISMPSRPVLRIATPGQDAEPTEAALLDGVFFALSDPVRRSILQRLDGAALLVSEIAAPFPMSLQAVSRHIQVLVRVGLVRQERSGRISRCALDVGPLFNAAVWLNRYTHYWQNQFEFLAAELSTDGGRSRAAKPKSPSKVRQR
jgi:DNA-binding transcriptional ArsR family regulator